MVALFQFLLVVMWIVLAAWVYADARERHGTFAAILLAFGTVMLGLLVLIPYLIWGRR